MTSFYFSLGSNLGSREKNLKKAIVFLKERLNILRVSSFYESEPWGGSAVLRHQKYVNCCVAGETDLDPFALLGFCESIEKKLGREKTAEFPPQPRSIDIDILFYDQIILESPRLRIPHPRIAARRFVLQPLSEIASDFLHPQSKKSVKELLKACNDDSMVELYKP